MKVFALHDDGQAPSMTEVALPEPQEGEVRVRVQAAALNGFDLSVAAGRLKGMMEHRFPVVLGKDFAGTVDAVGSGVTGYQIGDRVFGVVTKDYLGDGSFGEYVTVPAAVGLSSLPDQVDFTEGAALGLAGTAAVDAFDAAQIGQGATVLIAGATGGVGQQALQLAVRAGAEVIATASSAEEIELVKRLGAAQTVDYQGDVVAQVLAGHPDGVDVVLNFAGDPAALVPAVKPGGKLASTLIMSADAVPAEGIEVLPVYANPAPATLARLAQNQADGATAVTVQHVYPLADVPQAIDDFGAGTLGKLVITLD
ncbi:NADP-dependent oxidoreductase [Citricoccus sp. NPDC079358]|uniref:NADP-dependent oxidoreductase n=1 Tax=Citricoccus sp. NPDC079358 TaxID=3154653 RepID=UPI00344B9F89